MCPYEKLENVAIPMHDNLRPPDAGPVLIRFNYYNSAALSVVSSGHCYIEELAEHNTFDSDELLISISFSMSPSHSILQAPSS